MRARAFAFAASIPIAFSGCGSDASPATPSAADAASVDAAEDALAADALDGAPTTDAPPDADPYGPYPEGPYGNEVSDVVADLALEGYVNDLADALSSTKPWVSTSLGALRKKAPKGYALVHVSEFY